MKEIPDSEFIDLRKVLHQILSNWYLFAISLLLCLGLAFLYLKTTPKQYDVQATLQLKDQSLSDKGVGQEKFISGLELLSGNSELADEVGILSSHSMVAHALEQLDFTVSYFQYPNIVLLGKHMEEEIYQPGFRVMLDYEQPQLVGTPIHISFPDAEHYRIQLETDEAALFNLQSQQIVREKVAETVDETLPLGQPYLSDLLSFRLALDSNFVTPTDEQYYIVLNTLGGLTKTYASKLEIVPLSEESSIVNLKTRGRVPQKEKDFLNTLADVYIQHDLNKKNQLGLRAIGFIDSQLSSVYDSLQSVEGNLESFRAANQIIDVGTTSQNLNEQLRELEAEQAQLEVQQRYYQYTSEYLRNNENATDVVAPSSVGIDDPLLNNLLQDLAEMSREKVEKAYSSGANNPLLRVLESKIRNTKASLAENINNLINSNRIAVQENQRRINKLEAQLNRLPGSERNLNTIERRFALNDNIYNYLLEKRAEAGIAIASNLPNKSVVDPARLVSSEPVAPSKKTILVMAFLLGISIPLGLIWVQHFFDTKVVEKQDIDRATNLPLLGVIPRGPKKAKLPVATQPYSSISEAFRFLRITLDQQCQPEEASARIIGITSTQEKDGKTFCAANLSISYAKTGKKVLLIGADLRKPRLHEHFNIRNYGLVQYLENKTTLEEALQESTIANLQILGTGKATEDVQNLIDNTELSQLIVELKSLFDVIIIDTAPLGLVADYQSMAHLFDQHVFVVRQGNTNSSSLKGALKKLGQLTYGGIILNDAAGYTMKEYGQQYSKHSYYTQTT